MSLSRFIQKQARRALLAFHSIPGYLLYFRYGYGKFHITPLRYKRYCVDWIHNIEPDALRSQFEKFFSHRLKNEGELIFDIVSAKNYPHCHDEKFLSKNIHARISVVGEYADGHLSGPGTRRVISFQKMG